MHPEGKIEGVLVKVDQFILPADFIILDYEVDNDVPIIRGHPFLSTGHTLIEVHKEEIIMRVNDQEVIFNVFKVLEYLGDKETCQSLNAEDELAIRSLKKRKMKMLHIWTHSSLNNDVL